jgi:tRNA(Arg) A34 adenosine deaminase TadA
MCSSRQHEFCERARQEARKSMMEHKLGCVIVCGGEVVAASHNYYVENFKEAWSVHAEVATIMQLRKKPRKYFKDCEMYVVRVGTHHMNYPFKLSKPCESCTAMINAMGIRRVYYSTNDEYESRIPAHESTFSHRNNKELHQELLMKGFRHQNNHPVQQGPRR